MLIMGLVHYGFGAFWMAEQEWSRATPNFIAAICWLLLRLNFLVQNSQPHPRKEREP